MRIRSTDVILSCVHAVVAVACASNYSARTRQHRLRSRTQYSIWLLSFACNTPDLEILIVSQKPMVSVTAELPKRWYIEGSFRTGPETDDKCKC